MSAYLQPKGNSQRLVEMKFTLVLKFHNTSLIEHLIIGHYYYFFLRNTITLICIHVSGVETVPKGLESAYAEQAL